MMIEYLPNGSFLHVIWDGLPPCYSGGYMLSAVDDRTSNQAKPSESNVFVGNPGMPSSST